jgi:hypothetical protein
MKNTQEIQEWGQDIKEEIKKLIDYDGTQEDDYIVDLFTPFISQKLKEQEERLESEIPKDL